EVFKQVALVAAADMPVLIEGETGTGKELVARAIHRYSSRGAGPFVAVNCSLLAGDLVASELFGHEKGAFTGADRAAVGKVEVAEGGTLLLDEVGDLSAEGQARLLRFLDDGEFYRVGSAQPRRANVRVLAATNRPLRAAALAGQFRRDLFFRVCGVTIDLPPLRDRGGDVELLIDRFLARSSAPGISDEARAVLTGYPYPGNVRELRNAIDHAAAMAGAQPVGVGHLPEAMTRPSAPAAGGTLPQWARRLLDEVLASGAPNGYEQLLARWEGPLLAAAMERFGGNQARLAAALNIHRSTLRKKLRAHGLIEPADS
ncbi:MAG TPA: sigma-54 dependent transcriptional regulator, partial [Phycisphaerae bacterium]|nr:sigma-54 dependent transcriptional regulator [Phycisphaerae bacterium]